MTNLTHQVFLSLGANLGDRQATIGQALTMLHNTANIRLHRQSALYETVPVGYVDQPDFLNLVCEIHTSLTPLALLEVTQQIEHDLKRVRTVRWGPRTIDIDLLLFDNQTLQHPDLTIPHPRMHERAFVLVPLAELVPAYMIPGTADTVAALASQLAVGQEIRKR